MPLPIGHSLMSYAIHETIYKDKFRFSWSMLLLFVFVANLPDFDFLPGLITGNPHKYHRLFLSHSLGMSVLVGFAVAVCVWLKKREKFGFYFMMFTGVYFSHVFLDFLNADHTAPYGVQLLWPFYKEYLIAPVTIFPSIEKHGHGFEFIKSLFTLHNLWVMIWEALVFIPVLTIIKLVKERKTLFRFAFNRDANE